MLELNKIYNEDCLEGMKRIPDNSVDLACTDPPYLIRYKTGRRKYEHKFCHEITNDDNEALISSYIAELYRLLKDKSAAYIFCSSKTVDFFRNECIKAGFSIKNEIIWVKNHWTAGDLQAQYGQQYEIILYANKGRCKINGKRLSDVWYFPRVCGSKQIHQNQKPLSLIEQIVEKSSQAGGGSFRWFYGKRNNCYCCN